jgi:Fe-S-cluster containining protein
MNLTSLLVKAKANKKENKSFFEKIKRHTPRNLDDTVQNLHHETFKTIDCLTCANCCKTTSPIFRPNDIDRIAKHLKMRPAELIDKHLHIDDDGDYVLNTAPCTFLNENNYCKIYNVRPAACREYPHTDRKRFHQVLEPTLKNAEICPAVSAIIEKMKTIYK